MYSYTHVFRCCCVDLRLVIYPEDNPVILLPLDGLSLQEALNFYVNIGSFLGTEAD